eukprot:1343382-Amorphochlora_amoeboformis.AAC.1
MSRSLDRFSFVLSYAYSSDLVDLVVNDSKTSLVSSSSRSSANSVITWVMMGMGTVKGESNQEKGN